ncbi:MAG: TIGR03085 family metal-binding protein [Actinobacteria bacterium]|nr:TIGR03085 family metal-binding protein [Actinomycetota bacterium]MCL6105402.1 TIGR03085 family metal-binding protein [Actinomycetota bacterium]
MSTVELLLHEREMLCQTLQEVGPNGPTLCQGWNASDLAAHLLVREHNPLTLPGMAFDKAFGGILAGYTSAAMRRAQLSGFDDMISRLRLGPPLLYRMKGPSALINLAENWIHHEDLLRADDTGTCAACDHKEQHRELDDTLWKVIGFYGYIASLRLKGVSLRLLGADGQSKHIGKSRVISHGGDKAGNGESNVVTLEGAPGDIVLYLTGRQKAASISVDASPHAMEILNSAKLGL